KHRMLTPVAIGGAPDEPFLANVRTEERGVVVWRQHFLERVQTGAIVTCWQLAPAYKGKVEVELKFSAHVELRERPGVNLVQTLRTLAWSTRNLIDEFAAGFV